MKLERKITLLTALTVISALLGIVLILTTGPALTTVGVLLVIGSAVLFLVDVKDRLEVLERDHADRSSA